MSADKPMPPIAAIKPHEVRSPHGVRVDDYYWLRDDSRASDDVLAHLEAENAYTAAMLAHTGPLQEKLFNEIVGRIKEDDSSAPVFSRGYWYYRRYQAGQQYPLYCRRPGSMDAPEQVMLDCNVMAEGREFLQVGDYQVSTDNRLLAWTEDTVGRRQYTLRIKDLETGEVYPDAVDNVEDGIVWANDSRTVLYVEKDAQTLLGNKVRGHVLGDAGADALVYEEPDARFYVSLGKSKGESLIFIEISSTLVSEWWYADAGDPALRFSCVRPREDNHEYDVERLGGDFIIRTNWQAPNYRLMRVPMADSADRAKWVEVIPHSEALIEAFDVFRDVVAVNVRLDGLLKVRVQSWDGRRSFLVDSDEPAYTASLGYTPELDSQTLRYSYESLTTPESVYDCNIRTGVRTLVKREAVLGEFKPENYVTEFVHAPSRDGKRIPVSLVYRKGFRRDGSAPLLQYGYGAYSHSIDPDFSSVRLSLLDRGFVYAIAHIRGGEELGRHWYDDGRLLNKLNTFNDFIDVSEFLLSRGYAARDRLFAMGHSAGGLLMGAVVNLRPDLYRGIVTDVPFLDVVTTMLDESLPLTTNEYDEWGNPNQKEFYDFMLSYAPYDNVRPQAYPAILVETGLWDSQVQYFEPAKWVAKLRRFKTDDNPVLLRVNLDAGHGGKSGRYEQYRERAIEYAFILDQLGMRE